MVPEGLNRAKAANPLYAFCIPCESPTTAFRGAADGVASKAAVKVPVRLAKAELCQLSYADAVTQLGVTGVGVGVADAAVALAPCVNVSNTIMCQSTGTDCVRTFCSIQFKVFGKDCCRRLWYSLYPTSNVGYRNSVTEP